jgi:Carbohydrate-binding family 9
MERSYLVRRISTPLSGEIGLDDPLWGHADELEISHFHPRSGDHRPRTQVRLVHDAVNLFVRFDVNDRYVVSRSTLYQDMVCFDSCVEFFFRPRPDCGYFNFEINCGGTLLCYYVEDPRPTETGIAKYTRVSAEQAGRLKIDHSMPAVVFPERSEPTRWQIGCRIPLAVVEDYVGPLGDPRQWHSDGNFYKCADHSSHPHWASWSPIAEVLNFHQPQYFRPIQFE